MHNCPQCQNLILIEAHFCDRCGYRLADASLPKESQSPTPRPHSLIRLVGAQHQQGKPQLLGTQERLDQVEGSESLVATSIAAEHWRTSWRNRQRTEAGPATTVSRGHSSVPEPLLAMQYSLLRMRAIIMPHKTKQFTGHGFWITIVLMLCLIVGLLLYIISTFLPVAGKPVHVDTHIVMHQPTLTIQGAALATIAQEQILHLCGENLHTGVHL